MNQPELPDDPDLPNDLQVPGQPAGPADGGRLQDARRAAAGGVAKAAGVDGADALLSRESSSDGSLVGDTRELVENAAAGARVGTKIGGAHGAVVGAAAGGVAAAVKNKRTRHRLVIILVAPTLAGVLAWTVVIVTLGPLVADHNQAQDGMSAAEPRAKLSRRGLRWALEGLVIQHLTIARVAESLDVSWNTANDAVLAEGQRLLIDDPHRFDGVTAIGVDEHSWRHTRRGDKFVTVIIDLTGIRDATGPARLLDMIEGRSKQAFKTWLADRPQD